MDVTRRAFVGGAAALLATSAAPLRASALAVPVVDRLELAVLVDGSAALFGVSVARPDLTVIPTPRLADYRRAFRAD